MTIAYSERTRRLVRNAWLDYAEDTKSSQRKAAKDLGMYQSAFSQYLRGPDNGGIPLNTDFLVKFARLVNRPLSDFGVEGLPEHMVRSYTVPIRCRLSGRPAGDRKASIHSMVPADDCFAVEVDYHDHIMRYGTLVIARKADPIREGDTVVMIREEGESVVMGTLRREDGEWEIYEPHWAGGHAHVVDPLDDISRVVGTYTPTQSGEVFRP